MLAFSRYSMIAGMLLCVAGMSFAQDDNSTSNFESGKAYVYAGTTKYFVVPSKFIFGSGELEGSAIVAGYRLDSSSTTIPDCLSQHANFIFLERVPGRWWQKPYYVQIPSPPIDAEFVVLPRHSSSIDSGFDCPVEEILVHRDEFFVDWVIANKLDTNM